MLETLEDWRNREIRIERSKGGKISVCNYEDNLIIPPNSVWPHPDIVKKLYESNLVKHFDTEARNELEKRLGYYCDLQSLRSEDAITWSVFGTLHYFDKQAQASFVNSLLKLVGEEKEINECFIELWTRIPHPETRVSGGPELDFQFICDKIIIFGECKWTSRIAEGQGKNRDKNQIELRKMFIDSYGAKILGKADIRLVLISELDRQAKDCSCLTWEEVCNRTEHPLKDEIKDYYLRKRSMDYNKLHLNQYYNNFLCTGSLLFYFEGHEK
jgi:hypothetical protein